MNDSVNDDINVCLTGNNLHGNDFGQPQHVGRKHFPDISAHHRPQCREGVPDLQPSCV